MKETDYLPWKKDFNYDLEALYNMPEEQAQEEHKKWKAAQHKKTTVHQKNSRLDYYKSIDPGPLSAWYNAHYLRAIGELFEIGGERNKLLEALFICVTYGFALPKWLEIAFAEAYMDVSFKAAISWDEVFGKPHPKGTRATDEREKLFDAFLVWKGVIEMQEEGHSVDEGLFSKLGRELGIGGKTKVAEL